MPARMAWIVETLGPVAAVWRSILLGVGLMLIAMFVGMGLAAERRFVLVRAVAWWVGCVISPLLSWRAWWRRAGAIFLNNIVILAGLVAIGAWPPAAIAGIACVGLSMGIALRVLPGVADSLVEPDEHGDTRATRRIRNGILLNLLEPPAIAVALGLSLGRTPGGLTQEEVWTAFFIWVVPAMLLAAGGEALWIGEAVAKRQTAAQQRSETTPREENGA